jgi:hypothetical protein
MSIEFSSDAGDFDDDELPEQSQPKRNGGNGTKPGHGRTHSPHFNPVRRDGAIAARTDVALHQPLAAKNVPPAPAWMLKPLKPPTRGANR